MNWQYLEPPFQVLKMIIKIIFLFGSKRLSHKFNNVFNSFVCQAVSTKGHKRFHGAFEGGFSAGYFNTVGSREGWKPSEFISSRENRHDKYEDSAEIYMDEEDMNVNDEIFVYIHIAINILGIVC